MAQNVADGTLDLAFVALPASAAPAGVELTPLASEPHRPICPADHRLAARSSVTLADLVGEPMAETPPGWGTRIISERAFAAAGVERTPAFEINDISTILDLVRNDLAVALLPGAFVTGDPSLVAVPVRPGALVFEIALARPSARRLGRGGGGARRADRQSFACSAALSPAQLPERGSASTVPVRELRRNSRPLAPLSVAALDDLAVGQRDQRAGGDVEPGLDGAVVAEADADAGVGAEQAALADADDLAAAARERAHDRAAAADVRAVADDHAGRDPALDHRVPERARVVVHEALVHHGRARRRGGRRGGRGRRRPRARRWAST